jgi:hypothetical protein
MQFEIIVYLKENKLVCTNETSFSHSMVDKIIKEHLRKNTKVEKAMLFWLKIQ